MCLSLQKARHNKSRKKSFLATSLLVAFSKFAEAKSIVEQTRIACY